MNHHFLSDTNKIMSTMYYVGKSLIETLDLKIICSHIFSAMAMCVGIEKVSIMIYDSDKNTFDVVGMFDSSTLKPRFPIKTYTYEIPFNVMISNSKMNGTNSQGKNTWHDHVVCLPLKSGGTAFGALNIHSIREENLSADQMYFLELLTEQAALSIKNSILYQQLEETFRQNTILMNISKALTEKLDVDYVCKQIINAASMYVSADLVSIMKYSNENYEFEVLHLYDSCQPKPKMEKENINANALRKVVLTNEAEINNTNNQYRTWDKYILSLPLKSQGIAFGVLNIHSVKKEKLSTNEIQFLKSLTEQASLALYNAIVYEQKEKESYTDGLTGLHNHVYFQTKLTEYIIQRDNGLSLIMFDIDDFKKINDTHGHSFGDKVLIEMCKAVQKVTRGTDILARYGGEEFALICPGLNVDKMYLVVDRIMNTVRNLVISHDNASVQITISMGAAEYNPNWSKEYYINIVDKCLYASKESGKNKCTYYDQCL